MRICLLCTNDYVSDARARSIHNTLVAAGHDVSVVAAGNPQPVEGARVVFVPSRRPPGRGKLGSLLRRAQPAGVRRAVLQQGLTSAAIDTGAENFQIVSGAALSAARAAADATDGTVSRWPAHDHAGARDLIDLAPQHPELSRSPAGGSDFITPADTRPPWYPQPERHAGKRLSLVYRKTDSNPGKYLEAALTRAGIEVDLQTDGIDFDHLPPGTTGVVFVEGPYPAMRVTGESRVPVAFWAHHGEHHLFANIRLARRYQADAVMLAHSWHLAHWFPVPVHRFPFGVATELLSPGKRLADRGIDVAMVGAKLWGGGPYQRRQEIVAAIEDVFPEDRLGFRERVSAAEMAELYADARLVVNEGGIRHYPITMRVLETVGAGAVLVTDDLPGTDLILTPDVHYARLGSDVAGDCKRLLSDLAALQRMADAATDHALGLHTYDHRVDDLMTVLETSPKHDWGPERERSALASVVHADPEVQRIAHIDAPDLADDLPSREVWDASQLHRDRLAPGKMESVAVRRDDVSDVQHILRAARRYIYVDGRAEGLERFLEREHPQAVVERFGEVVKVDLLAESYRVLPHEIIDR